METIKEQFKSFIDNASIELGNYPLKDYNDWSNNMTNEDIAHILFLHASFIYARGFYELLKKEDMEDRFLMPFCLLLSKFGCKSMGIQIETFFIHMMNNQESVFSKYKYEIDDLLIEERREHHWSIGDITGSFVTHMRKVLPENLGISEEKVFDFIRGKIDLLSIFRNYLTDDSYFDVFTSMPIENDQALLRRPLWVKCIDQQQFVESFSKKFPKVNTIVWRMDDLTNNPQILESGVLFFIIPKDIHENEIKLVLHLLFGYQELLSKKTLLVVVDKQVIKYKTKIHYHEFLDVFDDKTIIPLFKNKELHNVIYNYGEYKVDETKYFDYFWVDE